MNCVEPVNDLQADIGVVDAFIGVIEGRTDTPTSNAPSSPRADFGVLTDQFPVLDDQLASELAADAD